MWKHGPQSANYCDAECRRNLFCDSMYSVNELKLQCNDKEYGYIKIVDFTAGLVEEPWVERIDKEDEEEGDQ